MSRWNNKIVIFDLDGTLADISARRNLATKDDGKLDWDIFLNRDNIKLDVPNQKVVDMARIINDTDRLTSSIILFVDPSLTNKFGGTR